MNGIDLIEIKFSYIWIGMIGFIHEILTIVGAMSFIVLSFMIKNSKTAQYWRNIYTSYQFIDDILLYISINL